MREQTQRRYLTLPAVDRQVQRPYLSLPEAAERLGIHRVTAWEMVKATGHLYGIPAIQKTRTRYVVSRAAIERIVREMGGAE